MKSSFAEGGDGSNNLVNQIPLVSNSCAHPAFVKALPPSPILLRQGTSADRSAMADSVGGQERYGVQAQRHFVSRLAGTELRHPGKPGLS